MLLDQGAEMAHIRTARRHAPVEKRTAERNLAAAGLLLKAGVIAGAKACIFIIELAGLHEIHERLALLIQAMLVTAHAAAVADVLPMVFLSPVFFYNSNDSL